MDANITKIKVQSKEVVQIKIINNVLIKIINMKLSSFANISAIVRHNDDFIENYTFHIEGDEYNQWGSNDEFIIDYILTKIGLTRREIKPSTPT